MKILVYADESLPIEYVYGLVPDPKRNSVLLFGRNGMPTPAEIIQSDKIMIVNDGSKSDWNPPTDVYGAGNTTLIDSQNLSYNQAYILAIAIDARKQIEILYVYP